MDYKKIGKRIRNLRQQQGYTQEALAEAVDRSVPYVSHIERASKKASLETISRIASALNVTVDFLLTGTQSVDETAFFPEMEMLLKDCLPHEKQIIVDVAEATKKSLRDNRQAA
ncbi:helix-turn-helix transcriptional regulator [Oscillospiraceae bacterium 50-58]